LTEDDDLVETYFDVLREIAEETEKATKRRR